MDEKQGSVERTKKPKNVVAETIADSADTDPAEFIFGIFFSTLFGGLKYLGKFIFSMSKKVWSFTKKSDS